MTTQFAVGRKGDGNSPGLVFMPYLMAESVENYRRRNYGAENRG